MTDLTLHNIRPKLDERLRRLAELQGLSVDTVGAEALSLGDSQPMAAVRAMIGKVARRD